MNFERRSSGAAEADDDAIEVRAMELMAAGCEWLAAVAQATAEFEAAYESGATHGRSARTEPGRGLLVPRSGVPSHARRPRPPGKATRTLRFGRPLIRSAAGEPVAMTDVSAALARGNLLPSALLAELEATLGIDLGAQPDSGPQPLDLATRARMGRAFGYDFSGVVIHRDSPLATGATRALVKDGEIHFRRGAYRPRTTEGDRVIAHELAHVVQQRGSVGAAPASRRDLEREADRAAMLVTTGRPAPIALRAQASATYAFNDDEQHDEGGAEHDAPGADHHGLEAGSDPSAPTLSRGWLGPVRGSAGRPLPEAIRRRLEVALKTDLGDVRIHDGAASDAAARTINAKAFTIGKDIHFAQGRFDPSSRAGQELIAHEVAHAAQHRGGSDFSTATISTPGEHLEVEAERFARDFVRAEADPGAAPATPRTRSTAPMARAPLASIGSVATGSNSRAVVYRDGGDGPPPTPAPKPKAKPAAKDIPPPDLDPGEIAKNAKDANDPEKDKKDKEKFEKDNPKAPKDPEPVKAKVPPPAAVTVPAPSAKGKADPPAKKGGTPDKTAMKPPPPAAGGPKAATAKAPDKGKAESAVCAAADADVGQFWAKAQKDPAANDVSKRSSEIWAASQGLAAAEGDDMIGALNPVTAVYNNGFAESDLGKAIAGFDQSKSPYADFNEKYRTYAMIAAGIRDVAFNVSNILGKIGLALTVVGFILSLFGVGAILITIGRVINIITIIMDVVAAVAGLVLVGVTAAQIKEETDPYKRAKLAKLLIEDSNKAASNVVNVVLATKGVGKVVGKVVKGIGKGLAKIARPIAAAISRVYASVSKFFTNLSKQKGIKGQVGKAFVGIEKAGAGVGKKIQSNRAKVAADVEARDTKVAAKKAQKQSTKAGQTADAKQSKADAADTRLDDAKQKKIDADTDLNTKTSDAAAKKTELEAKAGEAKTKQGELESAKTAEAQAKKNSRAADAELKAAEKAKAKAAKAQKAKETAATQSQEKATAAADAAEKAKAQREAAQTAETSAKEAAEQAAKAEKAAADAAQNASEAAERAKSAAGGDATAAAKAAEDAQKAAADASKAADDLAQANKQKLAADNQAKLAKDGAETAANAEKAAADAKTKAAGDAEAAAKSQAAADKRALDAQKSAAEAQAAAKKADADAAAATKAKQEADLAATEKQKAEQAKKLADDAAKKKLDADAAAAKAKADAQTAMEQKAAADKAAVDRAAAEQKAVEAQKAADAQKLEAAAQKQKADAAALESQKKSVEAQQQKEAADAQVKRDQADLAKKQADLKKAEQEVAAKEAKEAADSKAATEAKQRETQAATAKQDADRKLADDTKTAVEKAELAKRQKQLWDDRKAAATTAGEHQQAADAAAAKAKKASKAADQAQKEADKAAKSAQTDQTTADVKQKEAADRAKEAGDARDKAQQEATDAQKAADDAAKVAEEAKAHKQATDTLDPSSSGAVPKVRTPDEMTGRAAAEQGTSYSVGQMQQELATKNDGRDNWGTDPRWNLDPSRMQPRAPRMGELRSSAARTVNVSDVVAKIFAKRAGDDAPPPPTATPSPSGSGGANPPPAAAPEAKPGDAGAGGATDAGPIPYWPELTKTYQFDLGAMTEARASVQKYKQAQQKALDTAQNDLKKRAAEIRAAAVSKKDPLKQNDSGLTKDGSNLDEAKAGSKKQIENDDKNEKEKQKAEGPGQEGADAATQAAAAEPPPAKGWWGKIKAAANWVLKNTLGRAMKFVTDAITTGVLFVIKHSMGLDIREIANHGMTTADAGKAKAGEGTADNAKAGATNTKVETDVAAEEMTLGEKIAAGQKNVKEADEFEKAIDDQEKTIQAEIKACLDFVAQVEAQFAKCKAEAEAAKAAPPAEPAPSAEPAPAPDGDTPTPGAEPDAGMEALLREAATVCTGSIDAEIASLNALNAKGASLLHGSAGSDPGEIAEANRLAGEVERGALHTAIAKLEALRGKVASGKEDAITAAAGEIDAACIEGRDAIIDAYVAAEQELLAKPPAPPTPMGPAPQPRAAPP